MDRMAQAEMQLSGLAELTGFKYEQAERAVRSLERALERFGSVEMVYSRIEGSQVDSTAVVNQADADHRLELYDAWLSVKKQLPTVNWDFDVFDRRDSQIDLPTADEYRVTTFSH